MVELLPQRRAANEVSGMLKANKISNQVHHFPGESVIRIHFGPTDKVRFTRKVDRPSRAWFPLGEGAITHIWVLADDMARDYGARVLLPKTLHPEGQKPYHELRFVESPIPPAPAKAGVWSGISRFFGRS